MPSLNFKPQFVSKIQAGTKKHTIRGKRAFPIKVGDKLYLFCGLRHPGAFRILPEPVECTKIEDVRIFESVVGHKEIIISGDMLDRSERERLAHADGFDDFWQMMQFWEGRLPFEGNIIHWR